MMHYGIYLPVFGEFALPSTLAALAQEAEMHGWDGFFLCDNMLVSEAIPLFDPWIVLAAVALTTRSIRLGTLVTPVPRRRPWKLAREAVTVDHLSCGRLVQGVGIGDEHWLEYTSFAECADDKVHAAMLDEGLEVLTGLWTGQAFSFQGRYYQVRDVVFLPHPIQMPRIPIWVAGRWPNKPPFKRAARWDGVFPLQTERMMSVSEVDSMVSYVRGLREQVDAFDVVLDWKVSRWGALEPVSALPEYENAGVTWWLESFDHRHSTKEIRERIVQGPPRS